MFGRLSLFLTSWPELSSHLDISRIERERERVSERIVLIKIVEPASSKVPPSSLRLSNAAWMLDAHSLTLELCLQTGDKAWL